MLYSKGFVVDLLYVLQCVSVNPILLVYPAGFFWSPFPWGSSLTMRKLGTAQACILRVGGPGDETVFQDWSTPSLTAGKLGCWSLTAACHCGNCSPSKEASSLKLPPTPQVVGSQWWNSVGIQRPESLSLIWDSLKGCPTFRAPSGKGWSHCCCNTA